MFVLPFFKYSSSNTGSFQATVGIQANKASATAMPKPSLDDGKTNTLDLE